MYCLNLIDLFDHVLLLQHFLLNYYLMMLTQPMLSNVLLMYKVLQAMLNHHYEFLIKFQYFDLNLLLDMLHHRQIRHQFVEDHSKKNIQRLNITFYFLIDLIFSFN
jgi:hypothetical protein